MATVLVRASICGAHDVVLSQPKLTDMLVDVIEGQMSTRPRFKPAGSVLSYGLPNLQSQRFKMQYKTMHSKRRHNLRDVMRAWRRQAQLQIDIRRKSKKMAVVREFPQKPCLVEI